MKQTRLATLFTASWGCLNCRHFTVARTALLVVGLAIIALSGCDQPTTPRGSHIGESTDEGKNEAERVEPAEDEGTTQVNEATTAAINRLTKSGWRESTAKAVIEYRADTLSDLLRFAPKAFEQQVSTWERLGDSKLQPVMSVLEKYPDTAGLLSGATNPLLVADSFRDDANFDTISSLYATYLDANADQLAEALGRHGKLICDLFDQNFPNPELLFIYPREAGNESVKIYDRWLAEQFAKRAGDLNSQIEFSQFVEFQGKSLREMLVRDQNFASLFTEEIWPSYERAIENEWLNSGLSSLDPNILKVFTLQDGDLLVKKVGNLAQPFFFGEDRFEESVHAIVAQVIISGDQQTVEALRELRPNPLTTTLLLRDDISTSTKTAAITKANEVPKDSARRLQQYRGFSAAALNEEVGPPNEGIVTWLPLYDTWQVGKKLSQGRDLDAIETAFGVLDAATIPLLLMGPLNPASVLKTVGKAATKEATEAIAENGAKQSLKTISKTMAKELGEEVTEKAIKAQSRESLPWAYRAVVKKNMDELTEKIGQKMTIEITGPVRAAFENSGLGRETFKKLTDLEARIFMRADRRVVIRLDKAIGQFAIIGATETAINAAIITAAKTEPGKKVVGLIVSKAMQAGKLVNEPGESIKAAKEVARRNLASWWDFNASGIIAGLATAS